MADDVQAREIGAGMLPICKVAVNGISSESFSFRQLLCLQKANCYLPMRFAPTSGQHLDYHSPACVPVRMAISFRAGRTWLSSL